jgi:two-component system sensor histidine kinase PilS (NtrC family)
LENPKTLPSASSPRVGPAARLGAILLVLATTVLVFPRVVFLRESFAGLDLRGLHRPLLSLLGPLSRSSEGLPLWNPFINFGQPYAANPGNHLFHPATALFFFLPFDLAFNLPILLAPALALAGMYFLLRVLGRARSAALFGGVAWGFGGWLLSALHYLPSLYAFVALAPFLGFGLLLVRRRKNQDLAGFGLFFGLLALAAEPTILLASPFFLFAALAERRGEGSPVLEGERPRRWRAAARLFLGVLLGLLVGAAVLLPGATLARKTSRAQGISEKDASSWSTPPVRMAELLSPKVLGNPTDPLHPWSWGTTFYPERARPYLPSIYPGLLVTVLGVAALFRRWRRLAGWIVIAVGGALLAVGDHAPFWGLARKLPLVDSLRYPEKLTLAPILALVVAASLGFEELFLRGSAATRRRGRIPAALALLLAVAGLLFAFRLSTLPPGPAGSFKQFELPPLVAGGVARTAAELLALSLAVLLVVELAQKLPPRLRVLVPILLLTVDLVVSRPGIPSAPAAELGVPPPIVRSLLALHPDGPVWNALVWSPRVVPTPAIGTPPGPSQWGIASAYEVDFDLTQLRWSSRATELFSKAILEEPRLTEPLLRRRGVSAIVSFQRPNRELAARGISPFDAYGASPVRDPNPFAFCADRIVPIARDEEWLPVVRALRDNVVRTAIVNSWEQEALPREPAPCRVLTIDRKPVRIVFELEGEGPTSSLLAVNQTWDEGWSARIDGQPAHLLRSDVSLSAIVVPAGSHRVELEYDDPSVGWGIGLSVFGLFLLGGILLSAFAARFGPTPGADARRARRDQTTLESALRWLLVLRIVAFATLLVAALVIQAATDVILPINYLYYLTAATFALTLVYIGVRQWYRRPRLEAAVQIAGDLLVVTALVYFTGVDAGFSFLYLVVIGTAAALFLRRGALATASAAGILYGAIFDLMVLGVIPTPGAPPRGFVGPAEAMARWPAGKVYSNIFVNLLGFYAVALLTSYLAEKLRAARDELDERRSEYERLSAFATEVVTSLANGLVTVDADGRITSVNPAGVHLLGGTPSTWVGEPVERTGLFGTRRFEEIEKEASTGEAVPFNATLGETPHERSFAGEVSRLTDGSGKRAGIIVLFDDVTGMRNLEKQVRLKERMAAIGEMAAGIAHEIRNPLASIAGSVQVLQGESGLSSDGETLARIVLEESSRLNRIIEDFLRYVRPPERKPIRFDGAAHLAETVRLLRNGAEMTDAHQVRLRLDPPSFEIVADPGQFRQVLWNVAINGLRAMPHGGTLVVEAVPNAGYYSVTVRDTGVGMTDDERSRLFQPFKTKFDGGSGLGMAIVYRIVDEHEGRIQVESSPGAGTSVRVDWPVATGPTEPDGRGR